MLIIFDGVTVNKQIIMYASLMLSISDENTVTNLVCAYNI